MDQDNTGKYKALYEHSKELLSKEQDRFTRIDQKASWHMSALTVLIGIGGFLAKSIIVDLLPPCGFIEWCLLILGLLFGVFLIGAWFACFRVLKLEHEIRHLPLNQSVLDLFRKNKDIKAYYTIAKKCQEAFECNVKRATKKAIRLGWAYKLSVMALVFLISFALLYIAYKWIRNKHDLNVPEVTVRTEVINSLQKGEQAMTDKEEKPLKSPDDNQTYPNEDDLIVDDSGLKNIDLTEDFDPSNIEKKSSEQRDSRE